MTLSCFRARYDEIMKLLDAKSQFKKYNSRNDNQESVERLRLSCLNNAVGYAGRLDEMITTNHYLHKWSGSYIGPILLRIMFGNATIVNSFAGRVIPGNNIDQLTSPLAPKKLETFEEVFTRNLRVYSLPRNVEYLKPFMEIALADKGRDQNPTWKAKDVTLAENHIRLEVNDTLTNLEKRLANLVITPRDLNESVVMAKDEYYVKHISMCSQEVFVGRLIEVRKMHKELLNIIPDSKIATSVASYGKQFQQLNIDGFGAPVRVVENRFLSLVQSGIATLWKNWKFRLDTRNHTVALAQARQTNTKGLSMNDNIVVVRSVNQLIDGRSHHLLIIVFVGGKAVGRRQQNCFNSVDLDILRNAALKEYFRQPIADTFDVRIFLAQSVKHTVDFFTASEFDLHEILIPLVFEIVESGTIHGFAFWFDVAFEGSQQTVWLSIATNLKNPYFQYTGQPPQPPSGHHTSASSDSIWAAVDSNGRLPNGGVAIYGSVVDGLSTFVDMAEAQNMMYVCMYLKEEKSTLLANPQSYSPN
ncbi:unnamed protein product [Orchesella dallaii]|uniref:type I protein arginine methyltransferase n=1 Tax=Orchesella dallaii TaxID=48710 RepID=A0ABP1PZS0_9HEXA